jgi:cell division protein FtsI/penicillin-binding protein 2
MMSDIRLKVFKLMMIGLLLYIVLHLVTITLFDPFDLEDKIQIRHRVCKKEKYYQRGDIYDRNGNLLVSTQYNYQLDLDKNIVRNRTKSPEDELAIYEVICRAFCGHTRFDYSTTLERITGNSYSSVFLGDNLLISHISDIKNSISKACDSDSTLALSPKQIDEALIVTRLSEKRVFPYEDLAPRLLGLATPDSEPVISPDETGSRTNSFSHLKGRCGIEKTFEHLLSGANGWEEVILNAKGNKVLKPSLKSREPVHGEDVYLTINMRYQEILEEELHKGLIKYQAKNAMGVIMDVHTGEILALAGEHENDKNLSPATLRAYSNLPISYSLEPGSTLKPLTALLALEDNLYKPDELIDCSPLKTDYGVKKRTIRDHHDLGKLNLEGVIVHSSNPGISRVAGKLGSERIYNFFNEIGLGRQTLSGIYGETKGIFRNLHDWTEYSLYSISFGQEISMNMLHLAVIFSAFANQGRILQPNILYYSQDQSGNIRNRAQTKSFKTLSQPVYLKEIQKFLRNVVKEGTAKDTDLDFIEISGKTGTSEIISVNSEGKVETRHNSIFAGYLPSNDPSMVIVIAFDRCKEDDNKYYFASKSAVPTFREVVKKILFLSDCDLVTSSSSSGNNKAILPNLIGMNKKKAEKILKEMNLDYSFYNNQPDGIISDQYPPANIGFNRIQQIKLALALPGEIVTDQKLMPDFTGLTLREACEVARLQLISLIAKGNGVVRSQSIPPHTEISLEDACSIILQ